MKRVVTSGQDGPAYEVKYTKRTAIVRHVDSGKIVGRYKVKSVLLGYDNGPELYAEYTRGRKVSRRVRGSTVLLALGDGKYIYVSDVDVVSFKTIDDDPVKRFYSTNGNNRVPYPYLVCENHTYLLLSEVYVDNEKRKIDDPYAQYYDFKKKFDKADFKKLKTKKIHG